jgi:hypothetical protein
VPVPLDEFPVHQLPLSMEYVGSGDRHFYDRYYFNGHDRTGEIFFLSGLGIYPNLGTTDAYFTVRRGDHQWSARFSDALADDRLHPSVGDYRIEVIEPLHKLRIVCDGSGGDLAVDLTWTGTFPALNEHPHIARNGRRTTIESSRFNQVGTWEGTLRVAGDEITVRPEDWGGTRDRSWGIRPVGAPEPPGRPAHFEGFWWVLSPLAFEEFSIVVAAQELPDGTRTHNDALRIWSDGRVEQLGWPEITIEYQAGTRQPRRATIDMRTRAGEPVRVQVETLTSIALHLGAGYGTDAEWHHGVWKGEGWASERQYDLTDPEIAARFYIGVVDHACLARCGDAKGWGLFEHGSVGRHDPSGFADFSSVAL